eukprot:s270_g17.t1
MFKELALGPKVQGAADGTTGTATTGPTRDYGDDSSGGDRASPRRILRSPWSQDYGEAIWSGRIGWGDPLPPDLEPDRSKYPPTTWPNPCEDEAVGPILEDRVVKLMEMEIRVGSLLKMEHEWRVAANQPTVVAPTAPEGTTEPLPGEGAVVPETEEVEVTEELTAEDNEVENTLPPRLSCDDPSHEMAPEGGGAGWIRAQNQMVQIQQQMTASIRYEANHTNVDDATNVQSSIYETTAATGDEDFGASCGSGVEEPWWIHGLWDPQPASGSRAAQAQGDAVQDVPEHEGPEEIASPEMISVTSRSSS